uniref:Polyketide cyclase n=1 Tax=Thermosporothrix sp. COM3 TaxID=2490863 RepID=A0A455SLH8_9CHLR|nr:hypothetical protein KTC_25230 [Thermosporothrix sp. COM3]
MPEVYTVDSVIQIKRPAAEIYDFVSTPANWPGLHPDTIAVGGDTNHSETIGSRFVEVVRHPGRHSSGTPVLWEVTKSERPHLWEISLSGGSELVQQCVITYTLVQQGEETRFSRHMVTVLQPDAKAKLKPERLSSFQKSDVHDEYLRRVKAHLEGGVTA